jgi:hypothetical protein
MLHNLIMSCLHHTNLSPLLHPLDPIHEKPELEVQADQARAEEIDPEPEPEQGKTRCITPQSFIFI